MGNYRFLFQQATGLKNAVYRVGIMDKTEMYGAA
jgi:hypothetical protein